MSMAAAAAPAGGGREAEAEVSPRARRVFACPSLRNDEIAQEVAAGAALVGNLLDDRQSARGAARCCCVVLNMRALYIAVFIHIGPCMC